MKNPKAIALNPIVSSLLLDGAKVCGRDADGILCYVEERLTLEEYAAVESFLHWVFENNKTFGWGNISKVWAEWQRS